MAEELGVECDGFGGVRDGDRYVIESRCLERRVRGAGFFCG